MWSDEEIRNACFAEFASHGFRLMRVENAEALLRRMRTEAKYYLDLSSMVVRASSARRVEYESRIDGLHRALEDCQSEADSARALVELLRENHLLIKFGNYQLWHDNYTPNWRVTQLGQEIYTGDLAGAIAALKQAAGGGG